MKKKLGSVWVSYPKLLDFGYGSCVSYSNPFWGGFEYIMNTYKIVFDFNMDFLGGNKNAHLFLRFNKFRF